MQLNEGDGVDSDAGGGPKTAGEIRVRACLSRRGCRWTEDIASNDRQQASGIDAGVWVRDAKTPCRWGGCALLSAVARSLQRCLVVQKGWLCLFIIVV